jgi:aconitate hydratase
MKRQHRDPFNARDTLRTKSETVTIYRLDRLETAGGGAIARLPFSIRVLLEAALRQVDGHQVEEKDVLALSRWSPRVEPVEIPFKPARVVMQDFTGVPAVVDLAAMRAGAARLGADPRKINPVIPVDLVIDHSVQVDRSGAPGALAYNAEKEFERNRERYEFLRWGAAAFDGFRVVPPATGIVHQVNLEYLASVVALRAAEGEQVAFPDSLVGTDSHTTMINGLGVVGWGVGGIEAEAAMLGQPLYLLTPEVVGLRLDGELPPGATATDLVLTVTEILRKHGVVDKFVEFFGPGLARLSLADRATIANMAPEYGATMGFFPVDRETLRYLAGTGRPPALVDLVERYTKEQGLFHDEKSPEPEFNAKLALDMGTVQPSLAGPRRPQDRVPLRESKQRFLEALKDTYKAEPRDAEVKLNGSRARIGHGSVVIAAITSCTNTSNPSVMIGAGLLARKAVERGLEVPPYVKTSLAPGSRVVTRYLEASGLLPYLEKLRFHVVGYGCTTCIGNSGPLEKAVSDAIHEKELVAAAVLSGNRNFEGRISPDVRANYLASPPLVVAYALAGTMAKDLGSEPLGTGKDGRPVYLQDIWPTQEEIRAVIARSLSPEMFEKEYRNVFNGNEAWNRIAIAGGDLYEWQADSTYIREPSFFTGLALEPPPARPLRGARVLALVGDSVTTDHISPAGAIPAASPAGKHLVEHGVAPEDFNSFGSRRGNHEVMIRGTFGNIRLRNKLVPGVEGYYTRDHATGEQTTIYAAAMRAQREGTPLIVIAGKEYGTGSSRDWAAKGTLLLGVRAVLAESYERIHRSNLVGMGVMPLEFRPGESAASLGLTGSEVYDLEGLEGEIRPRQEITVRARDGAREVTFRMIARIDSPVEVEYYRHGGILPAVLRGLIAGGASR